MVLKGKFMIEVELELFNFVDVFKMVLFIYFGFKMVVVLELLVCIELMVCGGGCMFIVMDQVFGVIFKDLDGNIFIDFFVGVGVSSVGCCNLCVVEVICE